MRSSTHLISDHRTGEANSSRLISRRLVRAWASVCPAVVGATAALALLGTAAMAPSFAATPSTHVSITDAEQVLVTSPNPPVEPAARLDIASLAAQRNAVLADASARLQDANRTVLLSAHHKRASASASLVKAELDRLRNLSTFLWPTEGEVGSPFGWRIHPILRYRKFHNGADIGGACNNPIYAAQAGIVVKTGLGYSGGSGNNVRIDHGDIDGRNIQTAYLHMTRFVVKLGQRVDKGQLIGYVGSTGLSTACHLHLSLYKDGVGSDPLEYVKK